MAGEEFERDDRAEQRRPEERISVELLRTWTLAVQAASSPFIFSEPAVESFHITTGAGNEPRRKRMPSVSAEITVGATLMGRWEDCDSGWSGGSWTFFGATLAQCGGLGGLGLLI